MKRIYVVLIVALLVLSFVGCSQNKGSDNLIRIGVSPEPHAKIVELIKDDLEKQGIKVEIIEFTDYVKPNLALAEGDIDANFFQHEPYMNNFKEENNIDIVSIGGVHI